MDEREHGQERKAKIKQLGVIFCILGIAGLYLNWSDNISAMLICSGLCWIWIFGILIGKGKEKEIKELTEKLNNPQKSVFNPKIKVNIEELHNKGYVSGMSIDKDHELVKDAIKYRDMIGRPTFTASTRQRIAWTNAQRIIKEPPVMFLYFVEKEGHQQLLDEEQYREFLVLEEKSKK